MLLSTVVLLWFLCGMAGIHLAFAAARSRQESFDPVHIWLAILGPISLVLAGIAFADGDRAARPANHAVPSVNPERPASAEPPARFPPASVRPAAAEEGRQPFRATGT